MLFEEKSKPKGLFSNLDMSWNQLYEFLTFSCEFHHSSGQHETSKEKKKISLVVLVFEMLRIIYGKFHRNSL